MTKWQSIETAPIDGTTILAFGLFEGEDEMCVAVVSFDDAYGCWRTWPSPSDNFDQPDHKLTHWMLLPDDPQ